MKKTNCNIIRDLLPSYIDEITSEESNHIIEEHFRECDSCRQAYESLKKNDFVSNKTDEWMLRYFKNIRQKEIMERAVLVFVTVCMVILQTFYNFCGALRFRSPGILLIINCVLYPVYGVILLRGLAAYKEQKPSSKRGQMVFVGEMLSILYMTLILFYVVMKCGMQNAYPFGLNGNQVGVFVAVQILILALLYILVLVAHIFFCRKRKNYSPNIIITSLAGLTVMLNIKEILGRLDGSMTSFLGIFSLVLTVVAVESIILRWLYQWVNKSSGTFERQ